MNKKKIVLWLLSGVLLTTTIQTSVFPMTVYGENEKQETVAIASKEVWFTVAKNCMTDSYSMGKTFRLDADLTFDNDFIPIPYMAGDFEGNGHSLNGICIEGADSDTAVFRYVSETGSVKDLAVDAAIKVKGTSENIGGIVSHNAGLLQNLILTGTVRGEKGIGGIVAWNEEAGVINACTNEAQIFGTQYCGGICGNNYGYVIDSMNAGKVNVSSENATFESVGGIAGFNHGMISGCENQGEIGYQHIGYNVGGIAGQQDGKIIDSSNYATIHGRKDTGGIVGQFAPYTTVAFEELYVSTISNSMNNITSLSNQLTTEMSNLETMTLDTVTDATADLADSTYQVVTDTEDLKDIKGNMDEISASMDEKRQNRNDYSKEAQKSMDRIVSLTDQINREMKVIDSATKALESKDEEDVFVDISSSASASDENGYLWNCVNYGEIYADSNVGGIVGTMDFDNTNNPEEDITTIGDLSLNLHATIQLVVDDCDNMGNVYVVNDSAGGIVGVANHGYIKNSKNVADVASENGNYVGGIVAVSEIPIEQCSAHCSLMAESYVGGIAAKANTISNCASIVNIVSCEEKYGAIAACVDEELCNNYFVSDELGGIDGISYVGKAESLSYRDMKALLELDPDFYNLSVMFVADGKLVETVKVAYGGTILDSQIPEVPRVDEDSYGGWELFEKEGIEHSFVVHAVYDKWTVSIATGEETPEFLLEGRFYPDTTLEISALPVGEYRETGFDSIGHYTFQYKNTMIPEQDQNKAHLYWNKEENSKLQVAVVKEDGSICMEIPQMTGKYLVFDVTGAKEFYILSKKTPVRPILMILGGILIFILIFLPFTVGLSARIKNEKEMKKVMKKHNEKKQKR